MRNSSNSSTGRSSSDAVAAGQPTLLWWWESRRPRLGPQTQALIADAANEVFVSAATIWELAIKRATGQLQTPAYLEAEVWENGFIALPITFRHAERAGRLPLLHRDPFDRMLVAQAQAESLTLITGDASIARYAVPTLSATA